MVDEAGSEDVLVAGELVEELFAVDPQAARMRPPMRVAANTVLLFPFMAPPWKDNGGPEDTALPDPLLGEASVNGPNARAIV